MCSFCACLFRQCHLSLFSFLQAGNHHLFHLCLCWTGRFAVKAVLRKRDYDYQNWHSICCIIYLKAQKSWCQFDRFLLLPHPAKVIFAAGALVNRFWLCEVGRFVFGWENNFAMESNPNLSLRVFGLVLSHGLHAPLTPSLVSFPGQYWRRVLGCSPEHICSQLVQRKGAESGVWPSAEHGSTGTDTASRSWSYTCFENNTLHTNTNLCF